MYYGDIPLDGTIDVKFTTVNASGVPTTLAGTPAVAAYVGNSTTEITAGITLTVDFDGRTGLHNVRIAATSANGFTDQTHVRLVLTAGTVDGSSVVGYVVGGFSIGMLTALTAADVATAVRTELTPELNDISQTAIDVTALLSRIGANLFTGITSLAEWLGLLAGKQTGDATARTELRATGAGAGTFDETTDSQEALRDRGDAAYTTATGFSTHSAADVWAVGTRTLTSFGTLVSDIWSHATRILTGGTNIVLAKGTGVTGFNDPTAGEVSDAVWDEPAADHVTSGTTGAALGAAGSAGDPWETSLPGAYGTGTAGKIIGDNLNATVSSRASQTSVDDLPTNAELTTALGTLNDLDATEVQTAAAAALTAYDPPTKAELDSAVAPLATAAGVTSATANLDATVSSRATPAQVATELATYDGPTKAELDAAVDAAEAAILAAIPSAATNAAALLDLSNGVETSITPRQALRLILAASAGKLSGAATNTIVIRNVGDSKDRITATVTENGDRTAVTVDAT